MCVSLYRERGPLRMLVEVGFKEVLGTIWGMAGLLFDSKTCTSGGIILALGSVSCNKLTIGYVLKFTSNPLLIGNVRPNIES